MPYIPPYDGGVEAGIVLPYQDPGKMTSTEHGGSGFLGCENDDPSAQLVGECLDAAGLNPRRVTPWNAYPWFLPDQGGLNTRMVKEGLEPLRQLLGLLRDGHTVVTGGTKAHDSWRRFTEEFPDEAARWRHISTFHTSGRGITNGGRQTKADGVALVVDAFRDASTSPSSS
ncbi:uracil-DNA glycosylase [Gemmatimonas sp.]|uniref:uracil-DNA glycosylase n=1 Tax=Gemmatimonas sp. TaxID=1962908 RepID=UPI00356A4284